MNFPKVAISDLVTKRTPKKDLNLKDSVWCLNLDQIESNSGTILSRSVVFRSDLGPSTYHFEAGTVLYSKLRPYLNKVVVAEEDGFATTELVPLVCDQSKIYPHFLAYFLRSNEFLNFANTVVAGAKMPRMVMSEFWQYKMPLPPLAEQRRIAAILDQADALRAKRRESLAQLETLKQSIFLDMFGDPVSNAKRFPTHRIKDLARVVTGRTPPSSKDGMFNGSVPFITPGDLESDRPISRFLTTNGVMFSETVRKGSTLVCCIGATIGKMGQAGSQCSFNQQINAIEWNSQILDDYGFAVFGFFKKNIASWGTSTTLPILKKSSFEQIEIPVVPIEQQKTFSMALSSVRIVESQSKQSLLETENLFSSLQHRAFRGEL